MDNLNKRAQEDINRILAEVDAAKQQAREEPTTPASEEAEPQPTRLIDIHVYDLPAEEETAPDDQESQETSVAAQAESPRPKQQRARLLLIVGGLCLLLIAGIVILLLYPLFVAEATVTIIPLSKQISITSTVIVNTGSVPGTEQIPGNQLAAVTMSQAQSVPTTGKGHQNAQPGHGLVTFYNAAPYMQTVTAGTLLTGADGIQVVTEQDAVIPAGMMPTEGQVTVSAHTLQTGPAGNIKAGDIYGACCRVNVLVANGAFTGGQDTRDFPMVTPTDINAAADHLKSSLDQSVQAALKTQIAANQTLITPLSCQTTIAPDHQPGTEATQVRVTVSEICTGATYNTQSFQRLVREQIDQQARGQRGKGYAPTGAIQSHISKVTPEGHGRIMLQVSNAASYAYQFTQVQQQTIKSMIAGKSKAQATSILLQVTGVQSVSFTLSYGEHVPTDPGRIHLAFLVAS